MALGSFLEGLLQAIGQGALQNYNVRTLGPDFKEKREAHASQMKSDTQQRLANALKIREAEEIIRAQQTEGAQLFPGIDVDEAVRRTRAKRSISDYDRKSRSEETDIKFKEAGVKELEQRPQRYQYDALLDKARIDNYLDLGRHRREQEKDADARESRLGQPKAPKEPRGLTPAEFLAYQEKAREKAEDNMPPGSKTVDPAAVQAELDKLLGAYAQFRSPGAGKADFSDVASGNSGRPPAAPASTPRGQRARVYRLPDGREVPWAQVPPAIQAALKQIGQGE